MVQIYCGYKDCENLEQGRCEATAVRIDPDQGCLTYLPVAEVFPPEKKRGGDSLTWDREFMDDDTFDEDIL